MRQSRIGERGFAALANEVLPHWRMRFCRIGERGFTSLPPANFPPVIAE